MARTVTFQPRDATPEPDLTYRNPIALTASAANASRFLQTALSKLPPHKSREHPRFLAGAALIGSYRLSGLMIVRMTSNLVQADASLFAPTVDSEAARNKTWRRQDPIQIAPLTTP